MIWLQKSVSYIREERIEQMHQFQDRDNNSSKHLSNPEKAKELKIKR